MCVCLDASNVRSFVSNVSDSKLIPSLSELSLKIVINVIQSECLASVKIRCTGDDTLYG